MFTCRPTLSLCASGETEVQGKEKGTPFLHVPIRADLWSLLVGHPGQLLLTCPWDTRTPSQGMSTQRWDQKPARPHSLQPKEENEEMAMGPGGLAVKPSFL